MIFINCLILTFFYIWYLIQRIPNLSSLLTTQEMPFTVKDLQQLTIERLKQGESALFIRSK